MAKADQATENVTAACKEILAEQLPKLIEAVGKSGSKGALAIRIDLSPHKELADRVFLTVTPRLSLPGGGAVWGGRIDVKGGERQLTLLSVLGEVA